MELDSVLGSRSNLNRSVMEESKIKVTGKLVGTDMNKGGASLFNTVQQILEFT
jgi:hypothetical protein